MSNQTRQHRRAAELADRLASGWQMCDAERDPNRRTQLERHWVQLLREYETASDLVTVTTLPRDQPQQSEMKAA